MKRGIVSFVVGSGKTIEIEEKRERGRIERPRKRMGMKEDSDLMKKGSCE